MGAPAKERLRKGERRSRELAAIHMGKKALGWDDELYRAVLKEVTGLDSAKDLDASQRAAVLDLMRLRGFTRAGLPDYDKRKEELAKRTKPQIAMIRGLWEELRQLGAIQSDQPRALRQFCKRMTGLSSLDWISPEQGQVIIEGLKAMRDRHRGVATS